LIISLKINGNASSYKVDASNKQYEIWQRDSFAIEIYSRKVAKQELNYIHVNPVNRTHSGRLGNDFAKPKEPFAISFLKPVDGIAIVLLPFGLFHKFVILIAATPSFVQEAPVSKKQVSPLRLFH
jgi:hypothetical protein